ncbi:hypothetical protein HT576_03705 [Haloterrigena sp. SYSU A121-1]|uniref:Uncharacterized protein n=1 Tax=Haloterrigena gelatinilytica TaxID=2741724 RepID=A0A8J8GLW5_9EURY|nr:hypothetical protein [Haloterrigena gelatinilytica]NUB90140.1 hypothetical protein [Haloterrigena gelatinilytica]
MSGSSSFQFELECPFAEGKRIRAYMVRLDFRVIGRGVCLTGRGDGYASDYFPPLARKLLDGTAPILRGEEFTAVFHYMNGRLVFTPSTDETVIVSATAADGTKLNPDVPGRGVAVSKAAIVEEILRLGAHVETNLEAVVPDFDDERIQTFLHAYENAQRVAREHGIEAPEPVEYGTDRE